MKKLIIVLFLVILAITAAAGQKTAQESALSDKVLECRTYTYQDSNNPVPPSISLEENHKFTFVFSAISSYLGAGTYRMDCDTLELNTDDGKYHYTFKIAEDTLVFDAENSSEVIGFADFADGAVFQ